MSGHICALEVNVLTHSCLKIFSMFVVWTYDSFENNYKIQHWFEKYLKGICVLGIDRHFSLQYFLEKKMVGHKYSTIKFGSNLGSTGMHGLMY